MTIVTPLLAGSSARTAETPHRPGGGDMGRSRNPFDDQLWVALTGQVIAHQPVRGLPLAAGLAPRRRSTAAYYAITTMEITGRLGSQSTLRILNWRAGVRIDIAPLAGLILIRPNATGNDAIAPQGHVRLPSRIRHACHLADGERLLMVARPDLDVLLVYTMASLDTMMLADAISRQAAA